SCGDLLPVGHTVGTDCNSVARQGQPPRAATAPPSTPIQGCWRVVPFTTLFFCLCLLIDATRSAEYSSFGPREALVGKIAAYLQPLLALVVSLAFVITPAFAGTASGLGTVVFAEHANVGASIASVGSTIFGGDRLITSQNGSIQVRAGAARFLLSSQSSA